MSQYLKFAKNTYYFFGYEYYFAFKVVSLINEIVRVLQIKLLIPPNWDTVHFAKLSMKTPSELAELTKKNSLSRVFVTLARHNPLSFAVVTLTQIEQEKQIELLRDLFSVIC